MQKFCPNCGDPVEQDELFCDKCGTRIASDMGSPQQNFSQGYQNSNNYQNPIPNNYQNQQSYNQGQQNMNQYAPNPQYQPFYAPQKKSGGKKALKIISIVLGVVFGLFIVLGVIANMVGDDTDTKPGNNTSSGTKPPVSSTVPAQSKPAVSNDKPVSGKALAAWSADINANARYAPSEKKIYVEYSAKVKNIGTGKAEKINVYLDPEPSDPNVKYLSINPKTIVNINKPVDFINSGATSEVKEQFYYSNIEASAATQEKLQDVANRYIKIPVLIEWQENGKTFTEKLTLK